MNNAKRVLITGASAGFGFDVVKALAQKGHTVYATMRGVTGKNAAKAEALRSWAAEQGRRVHVLELDVTDQSSVEKAVSQAVALGGIDVLINNAGVGTWGIDEAFSIEQAQQIFDINVFGVMRMNHAVMPHFRASGKGLVIYISSGLGRIVFPFMGIYGASKFAVEGYAESAHYELSPLGIQSVIVEPGAYGTTFLTNSLFPQRDISAEYGQTTEIFKAFGGAFEERAKAGGLGDPSEVVAALVEEVEREGERPLRRPVGRDVEQGVTAINATCQGIQDYLAGAFGFKAR